jgi:hypothetical protein
LDRPPVRRFLQAALEQLGALPSQARPERRKPKPPKSRPKRQTK